MLSLRRKGVSSALKSGVVCADQSERFLVGRGACDRLFDGEGFPVVFTETISSL